MAQASRGRTDFDLIFKIVIVGDSAVGKTNLLSRFTRNEFNSASQATLGIEFAHKIVVVDAVRIKVQVWDTLGQEKFRAIASQYYRNAIGALLVYDITDRKTFENLSEVWINEMKEKADANILGMVVGNKSDLVEDRAVTTDEGMTLAQTQNLAHMETSAKDGNNVEVAFTKLITEIYRLHSEDAPKGPASEGTIIGPGPGGAERKQGCCHS